MEGSGSASWELELSESMLWALALFSGVTSGRFFFLFNDPFACLNEHVEAATEVVQAAIANRALGPCSP